MVFICCTFFNCSVTKNLDSSDKQIILLDDISGWDCSNGKLDDLAADVKKFEGRVIITCHTDDRGSSESNRELSAKISFSIMECLISNYGISKYKISSIGKGEDFPLC